MEVVTCQQLVKKYGRTEVLDGMTFSLKEHSITGFIGRNGAGKTTLLRIMAGFLHHTEGKVNVFSHEPFNHISVSANTILVDEKMIFPQALNLEDILEFGSVFYPKFDLPLAKELLDYFSLKRDQNHHQLSKGMKSTFNLIFGLATKCPLTLLDEPMSGMDASVRKDAYRAILKDYLAHPRTIIMSSHHLDEMENLLEDILLIHDGKVRLHQPIVDIKEFAIGLTGKKADVSRWTNGRPIIHEQVTGTGLTYRVVEDTFHASEKEQASQKGISFSSVSANDLCIYLTNQRKGGIDDVFHRDDAL